MPTLPGQIRYQKHRQSSQWHVRETRFFIFHLEPPLDKNNDIEAIIKQSDERHISLREALNFCVKSKKDQELLAKINWWFYSDSVLKEAGFTKLSKAGAANSSGIHAAMLDCPWLELDDFMNHEEIHWLWGRQFGEAPSLLNEGIAEYFQRSLNPQQFDQLNDVRSVIKSKGPGYIKLLANNDGFWKERNSGVPVYNIGGLFTRYLAEKFSLQHVKDIFLNTYYEDDKLYEVIHKITGLSVNDIEADMVENT